MKPEKKPQQYWLWIDGQKKYFDYPPEPPGYTVGQLLAAQAMQKLYKREATEADDIAAWNRRATDSEATP